MSLKTTLHYKTFHLRDKEPGSPNGLVAYKALNEKLLGLGLGPKYMDCMDMPSNQPGAIEFRNKLRDLDGCEVELEDEFIFDNQWNTVPTDGGNGLRVFDWKDSYLPGVDHVRSVQWLEPTAEMERLRAEVMKCGYCGKHYRGSAIPADRFCVACIDSEYLKRDDLNLLRLLPAGMSFAGSRPPLTDAEMALWYPIYTQAQINGATVRGKARVAKRRLDIEARFEKETRNAKVEHDGALWLLDHVPGIESNAIYYNHTGRWSFGWRTPLDEGVLSELLDHVTEFPFPYDIKCADGRTLSGDR